MKKTPSGSRGLLLLTALLCGIIVMLFHNSFVPGKALFSNDGPLGIQFSRPYAMPEALKGNWNDLNWLGMYNGAYTPNFSGLTYLLTGNMGRVNWYAPISVLVIGLCAWLFFRRLKCPPRVAILAAIAAALNSNYFSNACWGLPSRGFALAAMFLALAAIETGITVQPILTSMLAGLAVGLSITEGGDNGAILSIFVGLYALWRTWLAHSSPAKGFAWGAAKGIIMVVFALAMAFGTIGIFMRTAVTGMAGTAQDTQTKEQKWDANTMWSLPKIETLRVIIPGLFGYRMNDGTHGIESSYWGGVGKNPGIEELEKRLNDPDPNVQRQVAQTLSDPNVGWRSSGAGEYAGVLVVLIAAWSVFEGLRKKGAFTDTERKLVLFWALMAIVAMGFGWGRHAPFYRIIYALPYFSTIRNPMKFFHALHLCIMILFAYGLLGLNRRYLDVPSKVTSLFGQLKAWWNKAPSHERTWTWLCLAVLGLSALAWLGFVGSREGVVKHLMFAGFGDRDAATEIARFSAREILLYVVFLAASIAVTIFIISGAFGGTRAKWAAVLLGAILIVDLCRANAPWIIYYDWKELYASNPILDTLRDKPHEHRVANPSLQILTQIPEVRNYFIQDQQAHAATGSPGAFQIANHMYRVYQGEWIQHQFPYYSIQSLDIAQEPRPPVEKLTYLNTLGINWARLWQLTNVRFVFGESSSYIQMLNQRFDPVKQRFRLHTAFNFNGLQALPSTNGPFALIEFTGALPRAKLYTNWEILPEPTNVLARLVDPNWDPEQSILISDASAPKPDTNSTNVAGEAVITQNPTPKLMEVRTKSTTPAMLLLNDKLDPEWHAYIDGKPSPVYRANYLVRAVYVPAGEHTIVFRFEMTPTNLYASAGCEIFGFLLLGVVVWSAKRKNAEAAASAR